MGKWSYIDAAKSIGVMPNGNHSSFYSITMESSKKPDVQEECASMTPSEGDLGNLSIIQEGGWDVKPFPIESHHRALLLATLVEQKLKLKEMTGWSRITVILESSLNFLDEHNLVDYSLLIAMFKPGPAHSC